MDRYDRMPGKERNIANVRQQRFEAEHSTKNQFVKEVQNAQAKHQAQRPNLKPEAMHFNAYQCLSGEWAQSLAAHATSEIDHVAFPVRKPGKDVQ